jgi:ubiquinone/menaquinone biosynthesis C-methylase UbiE
MTSERQPTVAYSVDQFRDPNAEITRLERQAQFTWDREMEAMARVGLIERGRLLDLGCGPGFVGQRVATRMPHAEVVGVDRDATVLDHARTRLAEVALGSADDVPFPGATFDGAYTRLVLRHLERPEAAVAELLRVVRPGGCIVASDSDDGSFLLDPVPPHFEEVLAARIETYRRRGADPFMGRKLPRLLRAAGLVDVRAEVVTVSTEDVGPEAFASILLMPATEGIDDDLLSAEDAGRVAAEAHRWGARPGAFGMASLFVVGGRKSDASP